MKKAIIKNTQIAVTAVGFDQAMQSYPRRIEINGISHQFAGATSRTAVVSGNSITHFFKMTDGTRDFLLKYENLKWELLS
jgi:hypothetical protein